MVQILHDPSLADPRMAGMFADRKILFVDLLGWDVPVVDGRYEIDQFDREGATYLIALRGDGSHAGSMRLLPTTAPHILSDIFAELCEGAVPVGEDILEITRLCLPTRLGSERRLAVRNELISAMVDHALAHEVRALTGVVAWSFLEQVMAMGWRCAPLGRQRRIGAATLGAFRIDLDADTVPSLVRTGIYAPGTIASPTHQAA